MRTRRSSRDYALTRQGSTTDVAATWPIQAWRHRHGCWQRFYQRPRRRIARVVTRVHRPVVRCHPALVPRTRARPARPAHGHGTRAPCWSRSRPAPAPAGPAPRAGVPRPVRGHPWQGDCVLVLCGEHGCGPSPAARIRLSAVRCGGHTYSGATGGELTGPVPHQPTARRPGPLPSRAHSMLQYARSDGQCHDVFFMSPAQPGASSPRFRRDAPGLRHGTRHAYCARPGVLRNVL